MTVCFLKQEISQKKRNLRGKICRNGDIGHGGGPSLSPGSCKDDGEPSTGNSCIAIEVVDISVNSA